MPPFLIVRVTNLPPKPWPLTIAGLPLYLTRNLDDNPMNWGDSASGAKLQIPTAELGLWRTPSLDSMVLIFEAFAELGVRVERVQWFGIGFKIVAASWPSFTEWRRRLPRAINGLMVGYGFGEEVGREPVREDAEDGNTVDFGGLGDLASVAVGEDVYMDHPCTGRVDGKLIAIEVLRLPVDETNEKIGYTVSRFAYFGNGNGGVEEGCCGAVLWDERQNVLGQFRSAGNNGYCYFTAFETSRRAGYKLSC